MARLRVDDSAATDDGAEVWPVYQSVFSDYSDYATWCAAVWDEHSIRSGFRLARAYDGALLVGFAYGYTGEHGQWWTDNAQKGVESAAFAMPTLAIGAARGSSLRPAGSRSVEARDAGGRCTRCLGWCCGR